MKRAVPMAKPPPEKPKLPKTEIKAAFDGKTENIAIDQIVMTKVIPRLALKSEKFLQILASIEEVGVIQPPAVHYDKQSKKYILLDGHLCIAALKKLGETEVTCLISTDNEAFTYNKHINRLSPIQEHKMILRAIERGVSQEKIARALNMEVASITRKKNLLKGICPEAVSLLKDKMMATEVFNIMRRMVPMRQIEAATLMNDANVYSKPFAQALFVATPQNQLIQSDKKKKLKGLSDEEMARMEGEMESLQREYQLIEENYGRDVMNMTLTQRYLCTLLGNARVVRYLAQHRPDLLSEFQKIADIKSLKETAA